MPCYIFEIESFIRDIESKGYTLECSWKYKSGTNDVFLKNINSFRMGLVFKLNKDLLEK